MDDFNDEEVESAIMKLMERNTPELYEKVEEATASEVIVSNIADFLQVASKHEHLLGTLRGVVAAASGDNMGHSLRAMCHFGQTFLVTLLIF